MSKPYHKISVERDQAVVHLVLDNPANLNAMDLEMQESLLRALLDSAQDPEVRVIVLRGAGGAFSSGGDIEVMRRALEEEDVYRVMRNWMQRVHFLEMQIRTTRRPVIASVDGVASGSGFNLALACDLVLASEEARFSQSFIRLGLAPSGTFFLPRIVGTLRANELMLLGDELGAREAEALGIVNRVVPADGLEEETRALAARLARRPPEAIAHLKSLVNRGFVQPLDEHLREECERIAQSARSPNFREGVRAFLEKRSPRFQN